MRSVLQRDVSKRNFRIELSRHAFILDRKNLEADTIGNKNKKTVACRMPPRCSHMFSLHRNNLSLERLIVLFVSDLLFLVDV